MLVQSLLNTTKQVVDGVLNKGEKRDPRDVVRLLPQAHKTDMHMEQPHRPHVLILKASCSC